MDGIFNGTAVKRERVAEEMSAQIDGLRRRIGDLQGEIKILKAKIAGQRAAIREKESELSMRPKILRNVDRFRAFARTNPVCDIQTAFAFYVDEMFPPKLRGNVCMDRAYFDFMKWLFSLADEGNWATKPQMSDGEERRGVRRDTSSDWR